MSGADPGFEEGGSRTIGMCKIFGHTPQINKPCLLIAAIACFQAIKCSVLTKVWTFEQRLVLLRNCYVWVLQAKKRCRTRRTLAIANESKATILILVEV